MTVAYADRVAVLSRAEGRARDVLYFLAVHADDDQYVRGMSVQTIADRFCVSWRHAKRWLQQLRELGEVETLTRGGGPRTNVYHLTLPPAGSLSGPRHIIP